MKSLLQKFYRFRVVRTAAHRIGPAVWRLPAVLRRKMTCEAKLPRLPGSQTLHYSAAMAVRPQTPVFSDGGLLFNQTLAMRPFRLPQPFCVRLPAAWLVGRHATPVTPDGRNLLSPFRDAPRILGLEPNEDLQSFLAERKFTDRGGSAGRPWQNICPLVSRLDPNYFHWMVESCGSLEGVAHYITATGIRPKILIRGGGNAYIRASLELLGFGGDILEWPADSPPVFVNGLIIPSIPGNRVACSPGSLQWLRAKFLAAAGVDAAKVPPFRKVYISRKPGGWRSVANDEDVSKALAEMGFETLRPEGLTLAQQIRLFAQTKIIAGMHGSGLVNSLFAPDASVLEMFGNYGDGVFYSIASGLNMPYASLRCRPQGDDIVVDLDQLARAVERLEKATAAAS